MKAPVQIRQNLRVLQVLQVRQRLRSHHHSPGYSRQQSPESPTGSRASDRRSVAQGARTPTLPIIPPAAKEVQDISALHYICLELARAAEEASETGRGLASRLGGHPLDPSRNHILNGDPKEKQKVKELMEALISGRLAW